MCDIEHVDGRPIARRVSADTREQEAASPPRTPAPRAYEHEATVRVVRVKLSDRDMRRLRVMAAERDTTLMALVSDLLREALDREAGTTEGLSMAALWSNNRDEPHGRVR